LDDVSKPDRAIAMPSAKKSKNQIVRLLGFFLVRNYHPPSSEY